MDNKRMKILLSHIRNGKTLTNSVGDQYWYVKKPELLGKVKWK